MQTRRRRRRRIEEKGVALGAALSSCLMARAIGHARSAVCGGQHRYPSTQSVRVRPIRIGTGWGWCALHAHRQHRNTRRLETSHLRLKTCASLGACFGISHPRGRASSAPRPGSAGRGRGWWRLRDGTGQSGPSFLLCMWIARGRPVRALSSRFGKHKYGFHGGAADPPHLRLRPVLLLPCRVIPIAIRSNPNDQPLRRHRSRQVHRYRWPGAHPFSARVRTRRHLRARGYTTRTNKA